MTRTVLRGLLRRRRGGALPELHVAAREVHSAPPRLVRYRELCGLPDDGQLPLLWPQVAAGPLHVALFAHADFPFPMLGIVHTGQSVERLRPLPGDRPLSLRARTGQAEPSRKGVQFTVHTEARHDGAVVWRSTMRILAPGAKLPGDVPDRSELSEPASWEDLARFEAPANIGRQYRKVSGDLNPIHLHPLLARPFGFPRAIAHGMWTLARTLALAGEDARYQSIDARFRKPVYLPSELLCQRGGEQLRLVSGEREHLRVRCQPE